MTINQALDKIYTSYHNKNMENFPDVQKLAQNLIDLKVNWGGNTQIENVGSVLNIIDTGIANPEDWQ